MQVLGNRSVPCPTVNLTGGFQQWMDAAIAQYPPTANLTYNGTFDPFADDVSFLVSMWTLEEIGQTGDKVCAFIPTGSDTSEK